MASNTTFVTCPYNEHHSVRLDRMQYHITKCQKNHPEADFAICPFNATHHIPRINLESHIKECRDKPIRRFSNREHYEDEKPIVYGSSFVPYECDPDFPESFSENPMTPISRVKLWGLGRGSLLTDQDLSLVIKKVEQLCPCPHRGCEKKFTTARACKVHLVSLHMYKKTDQIVTDVNMRRQEICPVCREIHTTVSRHMQRAHEKEWERRQVNLRTLFYCFYLILLDFIDNLIICGFMEAKNVISYHCTHFSRHSKVGKNFVVKQNFSKIKMKVRQLD